MADSFEILEVLDAGDDLLIVRGHRLVDGEPETETRERAGRRGRTERYEVPRVYEATGWVSALTNHFDEESYGEDGHRNPKAKPRERTADEKLAYCQELLSGAVQREPVPVEL